MEEKIKKIRLAEVLNELESINPLIVLEDVKVGNLKFYDDLKGKFTTKYELEKYLNRKEFDNELLWWIWNNFRNGRT